MNKFVILIIALALFACDNAVDTSPEGGIDLSSFPTVTVLYTSSAMGDSGYNDLICTGVYQAQKKESFLINTLVPDSLNEGKQMLNKWLDADHSVGRHLLIVTSDEYESLLRERVKDIPDDDNCKVILLESKVEDLPAYTFHISLYGTSYLAGALAAKITDNSEEVLVLRANSENQMIADAAQGFSDGYSSKIGKYPTDLSISEISGQGFKDAEDIYKLCNFGFFDIYRFVYPLIGGSINGLFQYYTETLIIDQPWVAGIDTDKSNYSINVPFSVVKHIDVAVEEYISDWLHGAEIPRHQRFGMRSGHSELIEGWWKDYNIEYLENLNLEAQGLEDKFEERGK